MQNRIVEIASDNVHLSLSRGFVKIAQNGEKLGQIDITDISALIVRGYSATISLNLCARLAVENVIIVLCSANQAPSSIIWPISGHFKQGQIMQKQADATTPLKKRLWQQIVKSKITSQAEALAFMGKHNSVLYSLIDKVQSGDKTNIEAYAAQRYWPLMMGNDFRRRKSKETDKNTDMPDINAFLNYGYTVLRAAAARSILAAGLHPSFSIHHESKGDALRLADDLMEPFRPWVDVFAIECVKNRDRGDDVLNRDDKAKMASILTLDLSTRFGASPVQLCMDRLAISLVDVFLGEKNKLDLPDGLPSARLKRA